MEPENRQDPIEHLAMLRGDADLCLEPGIRRQRKRKRSHLDRFGTRAEHAEGLQGHLAAPALLGWRRKPTSGSST